METRTYMAHLQSYSIYRHAEDRVTSSTLVTSSSLPCTLYVCVGACDPRGVGALGSDGSARLTDAAQEHQIVIPCCSSSVVASCSFSIPSILGIFQPVTEHLCACAVVYL